jgi:lipopolysaccharide biosynthesis glycosyltransferase
MTEFLDEDLEKVLYLDCDLIICDDIEDLWATDITHYFLAAVTDPYSDNHVSLGFQEHEMCFNAGVLLVNLAKWRDANVIPTFIHYVEDNSTILKYHDQCTLNAVFRGQVLILPYRWNFAARNADLPPSALGMTKEEFFKLREAPSIVHYTTGVKPWLYLHEPHYKQLYYEYLKLTPWRGSAPSDRTTSKVIQRLLRMERLKEIFRWRAPAVFRTICRSTGLGDPVLRNLRD